MYPCRKIVWHYAPTPLHCGNTRRTSSNEGEVRRINWVTSIYRIRRYPKPNVACWMYQRARKIRGIVLVALQGTCAPPMMAEMARSVKRIRPTDIHDSPDTFRKICSCPYWLVAWRQCREEIHHLVFQVLPDGMHDLIESILGRGVYVEVQMV